MSGVIWKLASMWRKRITNRTDMVARITHLTKGNSDEVAFDILWKIFMEKKLNWSGSSGYVIGKQKAVCFQEVPLSHINLLYKEDLDDKLRYSWFGLRFNKSKRIKKIDQYFMVKLKN